MKKVHFISPDRQMLENDTINNKEIQTNKILVPIVGLEFYDTTGSILIGKLDMNGNFGITGQFYTL